MDAITKALQVTTGSGANLIPEDLNPVIAEYMARISPLWSLVAKRRANGKTHEYVRRTGIPTARFEGELTDPAYVSNVYDRPSAQLKILRVSGGVSGFQQAASARFTNALAQEIDGSIEGITQLIEWSLMYGNKNDAYQFDGLEAQMLADATARKSVNSGGNILDVDGVIALSHLDAMIDAVRKYRQTQRDRIAFMASTGMISKISGLQTRVSRTVNQVEFEGGFRMTTYRDVPIIPTSYLTPESTTTSPAVTATIAAGGSLPAATYHYRIASVTDLGEQLAGASDDATSATTNNTADLTWTADPNALLYKIYRGSSATADDMSLIAVIAAKTYAADGSVNGMVASWSDTGTATAITSMKPLSSGEETLTLVNLDQASERGLSVVGMMSPLGDPVDTFVSFFPLATRKSAYEYVLEAFMAAIVTQPTTHVIARRAKLA